MVLKEKWGAVVIFKMDNLQAFIHLNQYSINIPTNFTEATFATLNVVGKI